MNRIDARPSSDLHVTPTSPRSKSVNRSRRDSHFPIQNLPYGVFHDAGE